MSAVSAVGGMGGMSVGRALFGEQREPVQRGYDQQHSQAYGQSYGYGHGVATYHQERQTQPQFQAQTQYQQEYHESPFEMDFEHQPSYGSQPQPAYYAQQDRHQQHRAMAVSMPRTTRSMTSPIPVSMRAPISPVPSSISPSSPPSYGSMSPRGGTPGSGLAQAMRRGAASAASAAASVSSHVRSASQSHSRSPVPEVKPEAVVTWSRWDVLNGRRILLVAYGGSYVSVQTDLAPTTATSFPHSGARLQLWDTSDLSSVTELLDIAFDMGELGMALGGDSSSNAGVRVVHAAVMPELRGAEKDGFEAARPLLGILYVFHPIFLFSGELTRGSCVRHVEPRARMKTSSSSRHRARRLLFIAYVRTRS